MTKLLRSVQFVFSGLLLTFTLMLIFTLTSWSEEIVSPANVDLTKQVKVDQAEITEALDSFFKALITNINLELCSTVSFSSQLSEFYRTWFKSYLTLPFAVSQIDSTLSGVIASVEFKRGSTVISQQFELLRSPLGWVVDSFIPARASSLDSKRLSCIHYQLFLEDVYQVYYEASHGTTVSVDQLDRYHSSLPEDFLIEQNYLAKPVICPGSGTIKLYRIEEPDSNGMAVYSCCSEHGSPLEIAVESEELRARFWADYNLVKADLMVNLTQPADQQLKQLGDAQLALTMMENGKINEARQKFKNFLQTEARVGSLYLGYANLLLTAGNGQEAIEFLLETTELYPDWFELKELIYMIEDETLLNEE